MDNVDKLVEYLKNISSDKHITAKKLSKYFGVTDRTIRNYVKIANERYSNIILTSKYGYYCERSKKNILFNERDDFNKSIDSRRFFIIREIFKNNSKGIDVFELSETLFVSESTIKSDIIALKKLSTKYDLCIKQKNFKYFLVGTDKNKRKLMIDMVSSSYQSFNINLYLQEFLEKVSLSQINGIVEKTFRKFDFEPNTYFLENFLLHLAIAIDRSNENISKEERNGDGLVNDIVSDISNELSGIYGIKLLESDIIELRALMEAEVNEDVLNNYVDEEINLLVKDILKEIGQIYLLEFDDEKFVSRLLIHIQNLYKRSISNISSRNLNLIEIKTKYPVLFDIAIFLSFSLSENLDIKISDEEIAFLALHIGTFVQNTKENNEKIQTAIITQFYNSNQVILKNKIEEIFGEEIVVRQVVDNESGIESNLLKNMELIISTNTVLDASALSVDIVYVKEFLFNDDINSISDKLKEIKREKFRKYLDSFLPRLFPKNLFFRMEISMSKDEILKEIEKNFLKNNFVSPGYYELLKQREDVSNTAFPSGVAIPHTIKYESHNTGIMIMSFDKEINWGNDSVSLVFALSIDKDESEEFNKIFPRIVEVISDRINVGMLNKCINNKDFINKMKELILADDYYV